MSVVFGLVVARAAVDDDERTRVEKLASARHAPKDWVMRARIVASSWDGSAIPRIAERVGCSARTARVWIHRFDAEGLGGLGDRERPGRPRRLSEDERSRFVSSGTSHPPNTSKYTR